MNKNQVLLECKDICKSFYKNKVLQNISLSVKKGEIRALVGQNGAGKSTLVKILTGVYTKDSGDILFEGNEVKLHSPQDAEKLGIAIIHQDHQMVPYFDVTRNAYLGIEMKKKSGALDFKKMRQLVDEKLKFIGADFKSNRQISTLTVGQREQVAIVSALLSDPKLLVLDEPTASLSSKEIDRLFEIIRMLADNGVTVIYISHHLNEVFRIADSITVLRDSFNKGTLQIKQATHDKIVTMMIGRELKEFFPKKPAKIGDVVLEVEGLAQGNMVKSVDLVLREGEIFGMAGLVGSGRTESMLSIYGALKKKSGEIKIKGKKFNPKSPLSARKAGIAFIPEDRRSEGIVPNMSVAENLSLADTKLWAKRKIINKKLERENSEKIIKSFNIVCAGQNQLLGELSGGNQQKVVVGRWMIGNSNIFIFDQPTTGVDVGAKTEIYRVMVELAQKGCCVIFVSSENDELIGMCDRIAVMHKGRMVKVLSISEATEQEILYWSSGGQKGEQTVGGTA